MVTTMTLSQYLKMWSWIENWQKSKRTKRLPRFVSIRALNIPGYDVIYKATFCDMWRRAKAFQDKYGRLPDIIGIEAAAEQTLQAAPAAPVPIPVIFSYTQDDVLPPNGSQARVELKFQPTKIPDFKLKHLEYHQDNEDITSGGNLTITGGEDTYKTFKDVSGFELLWGWIQPNGVSKIEKVMNCQITNLKRKDQDIEIEFTNQGTLLEKKNTANYTNWKISEIMKDIIKKAGLKPVFEGLWYLNDNKISYTTKEPEGKSYKEILDDLMDLSAVNLELMLSLDEVHVIDMDQQLKAAPILFADTTLNIVKNSTNLNDTDTTMVDTLYVSYGDENNHHQAVMQNKDAAARYGEKRADVDKKGYSLMEAKTYAKHELEKIQHKNVNKLDLTVIASPYFNILQSCKAKIEDYNINDKNFIITRLNFKLDAGKTPVMDLTLEDYTSVALEDKTPPIPPPPSKSGVGGDFKSVAKSLGSAKAIRVWIDKNIQYSFYYNNKRSPDGVFRDRRGNCYDQTGLAVAMMNHIGIKAWRQCGQLCKGYRHCNGIAIINGKKVLFDTTCHKLNKL
jgi:hypothetical protein